MKHKAKEKADELVDKFIQYTPADEDIEYEYAKQCALSAVDEILNNFGLTTNGQTFFTEYRAVEFWQEVKQEIEKL